MKWKLFIGFTFGMILMAVSAESYKEDILSASIVTAVAIYMFLLVGVEIGEQRKRYKVIEFEGLNSGNYLFMTTPVQHIFCSSTGECNSYFAWLEYRGEATPVIIGVDAKIKIQNAMKEDIGQIKKGWEFEINKNHNITRI